MEVKKIIKSLDLPYPLRKYQWKGVDFLLSTNQSLLADDMGLGKTVQIAVYLEILYNQNGFSRALIVLPSSLKSNWERELSIWAKSLSVNRIKGTPEQKLTHFYLPYNVTLASYDDVRNIYLHLSKIRPYDVVILDEAQNIKNKASRRSRACKMIKKVNSIALTGTPIENKKEDLVSLFDFLSPMLINDNMERTEIQNKIKKQFLRRKKSEVLKDLPPVIDQEIMLDLTEDQRRLYDETLIDFKINKTHLSRADVLALINALKQVCNKNENSGQSSKVNYIHSIMDEIIENKQKLVIFSQYVKTLTWLKNTFSQCKSYIYHGQMTEEEKDLSIETFKKDIDPAILFISLKAGGVGLNIQETDIIILFDRWWNPAVEEQAIARAHRFGRNKVLHSIKFIVKDTIEEKINSILIEKKKLFEDYIEKIEGPMPNLLLDELLNYLEIHKKIGE